MISTPFRRAMLTIGAIILFSYAPANASATRVPTRVHVYTGTHRIWTHIAPLARQYALPPAVRPYIGTVTTFPGTFPSAQIIAYDPDDKVYFLSLYGSFGDSLYAVAQTGHAKRILSWSGNIDGMTYDSVTKLLYIANRSGYAIDSLSPKTDALTIVAGGNEGTGDGQGSGAQFQGPQNIALDPTGLTLYVTDQDRVRVVTTSGTVTTLTAPGGMGCTFFCPGEVYATLGITYDTSNGTLYVADGGNHLIRQVAISNGAITTLAGGCHPNQYQQCADWWRDGKGAAALFGAPNFIQYDPATDKMYVSDADNNQIRTVNALGVTGTLAGDGHGEYADGVGDLAAFSAPLGLVIGPGGLLYVADEYNSAIRLVTPTGPIPPPPTHGLALYDPPTLGSTPFGITTTADGSAWFSESNTNAIGRIKPNGKIKEYPLPSGNAGQYLATDSLGNIWFTDGSSIGRLVPATGNVALFPLPNTVSGVGNLTLGADGNMWFTGGQAIGFVTQAGTYTVYLSAGSSSQIGAGFANDLWTLAFNNNNQGIVDQYSTSGTLLAQYTSSGYLSNGPITRGPGGNMWFGQATAIGEVLGQTLLLYELPPAPDLNGQWNVTGLFEGTDQAMWFAGNGPGYIGRLTQNGMLTPYEIRAPRAAPQSVTVAPNGTIWFTDPGAGKIGRVF
jgi:virginiamycin B lyase